MPIQVSQQIQNWLALLMLCLIVSFITACDYGMTQGNLNIQNLSSVVTNIQQNGNGDLVLSLSRDVNDTKIGRIEPSDKNPDYRTYIDLIF